MAQKVYTSAGVYTSETDMSIRASEAGATILAFVGESARGPANEIVDLYSKDEILAVLGNADAQKYGFAVHCALQAIKDADQIKFLRCVADDALTAGAYLTVDDPTANIPKLKINVFDDGANTPQGVHDPENTLGFKINDADNLNHMGFFYAVNPGDWNKEISIGIRPSVPAGIDINDERHYNPNHFYVDVFINYKHSGTPARETFLVSRNVEVDGEGNQMFIETRLKQSNFIRFKNNPYCGDVKVKQEAFEFLAGGTDGSRIPNGVIANMWKRFNDPENIDINTAVNAGYATPEVHRAMIQLAEDRFDTTAVLDLPKDKAAPSDAYRYMRETLNRSTSFAGMYAPYLKIRDTENAKYLFIPPSGNVAGTYARTHKNRAIWFAPAGITNATLKVLDVFRKYKLGERGTMARARVNLVRKLTGRGIVVMGQDTMQQHESSLVNINVRRLLNDLKKSLAAACTVSNFEPGDSITRLTLKDIARKKLAPIKAGRGLYDFDVICDERNNKPESIAVGDLYLYVILDPTIPNKRTHLTTHVMPTGTYFEEA